MNRSAQVAPINPFLTVAEICKVLEGFGFDALSFNAGASSFAVDGFGISVLFGG